MEFVPTKRKEDQSVLRVRAHSSITKHFRVRPEQINKTTDVSLDTVQQRAYDVYNSLAESQAVRHDSLIVSEPPRK
jgi:hypothetical protein